ncbi:MAG: GYF domain-containing protein [Planctomycetia bacterium]|nr:GYF domain-containing protein [Planctomycetia bacterium]
MGEKWYYKISEQEIGPITTDQLKKLAHENRLKPSDPVRRESDSKWYLATKVKGLFPDGGVQASKTEDAEESSVKPEKKQKKMRVARAIPEDMPQIPKAIPVDGASGIFAQVPNGIPVAASPFTSSLSKEDASEEGFMMDFAASASGVQKRGYGKKNTEKKDDLNDPALLKKHQKQKQFKILAGITVAAGLILLVVLILSVTGNLGGKKKELASDKKPPVQAEENEAQHDAEEADENTESAEEEDSSPEAVNLSDMFAKKKPKSAEKEAENTAEGQNNEEAKDDSTDNKEDGKDTVQNKEAETSALIQEVDGINLEVTQGSLTEINKVSVLSITFTARKTPKTRDFGWNEFQKKIKDTQCEARNSRGKVEIPFSAPEKDSRNEDSNHDSLTYVLSLMVPAGVTLSELALTVPGPRKTPFQFTVPEKFWSAPPAAEKASVVKTDKDKNNDGQKTEELVPEEDERAEEGDFVVEKSTFEDEEEMDPAQKERMAVLAALGEEDEEENTEENSEDLKFDMDFGTDPELEKKRKELERQRKK